MIAGALWGFGFIATVWAMTAFTPVEVLVYRFTVAVVVGEIIYLIARGPTRCSVKEELMRAFPAGFLLSGLMIMQTIGLKYTNATKSSFITSLYVIFVPLFNTWFFKSSSQWYNYLLALVEIGRAHV